MTVGPDRHTMRDRTAVASAESDRPMFPDRFWWGTGNSANQCEGAASTSTWWDWERAGHAPRSGAGNDFARRHADDFTLCAGLGLDHFRLSLEWARLEPSPGHHDQAEIERYRALLATGIDAGLEMWVTAHHFTLPTWFARLGGFANEDARAKYWRRHIAFLAETFGDLVYGWKPINEPHAFAMTGWLLGVHPPGRRDLAEAVQMLVATQLANHEAWLELRGGSQPVATTHDLSPAIPIDPGDDRVQRLTHIVDALAFDVWIDMIREGVLRLPEGPGLPRIDPIIDPTFIDAFDVIGFSYYSATGIGQVGDQAHPNLMPYPPGDDTGPLGYVPWAPGLDLVLDRLHSALGDKPLLVAEYGIGTHDDTRRCGYLDEGLGIVADALARGVDVRGFFHWTGVDNYEWGHGFDVPFGLFDATRRPRPSAHRLAQHIAQASPSRRL